MVHSQADYEMAVEASNILFGKATKDSLLKIDEATLLSVFEGVPHFEISRRDIEAGIDVVTLCTEKASVFASKGEMQAGCGRRFLHQQRESFRHCFNCQF